MLGSAWLQQQDIETDVDQAVSEVFGMMMGLACEPMENQGSIEGETITAVVGLAGAISGACVLRAETATALALAGYLVGSPIESMDDTVKDAIGEVCNMLAGTWKGKLPEIASACMLSVPAVVTGTNYALHLQRPGFRLDRHYRCGDHAVSFSVICDHAV